MLWHGHEDSAPGPCSLEHLGQHRLVLVHMLKNVEGSDYVELLVEG